MLFEFLRETLRQCRCPLGSGGNNGAIERDPERVGRTHRHERPGIEFGEGAERHMSKPEINTTKERASGEKGRQGDIRRLKVRGIRNCFANCVLNLWNPL
jgi:hypothetical protein